MDQSQRMAQILGILETEETCAIADLSQRLSVSDETIRRDVKQLEALGHVQKFHGGVRLPANIFEAPYRQRQHVQVEEKRRIGQATADLIEDGMTVFIESNTTAFWLARSLTRQRNLSIITNGVEIARELCGRNNNKIFFAGGEMSDDTFSTLGPTAIDFISRFTPDMSIFGASALDPVLGVCDFDLGEADFIRATIGQARTTVLIVDHSKFNKRGLVHIANYADIDILVSDQAPDGDLMRAMHNVRIVVAPENGAEPASAKTVPLSAAAGLARHR